MDISLPPVGTRYRQSQCDLSTADLTALIRAEQPDRIVHFAGNANVGLSVQDPHMDLNGSYVLLHRLLYGAKAAGCRARILFVSSAAVYGNPSRIPIHEDDIRRPVSPYGLHKAACEDLCEYFSRVEGIDCRIVRIFSAYGSGLRKQILWDLCTKLRSPGPVEMFGTGAETRDFIHVADVVQAIRLVLESGKPGAYNLANGTEVRIDELARALLAAAGEPIDRLRFNGRTKEGDPLNWKADIGRLQALGYRPTLSLEQGVLDYWHWRSALG